VLLLMVGVAVSQLAAYARRLKVIAITDAGYLAQIQETTALAQPARSPHDVAEHVREQPTVLLGLEQAWFGFGSLLSHPPRLQTDGTVTAGAGRRDGERIGLPEEVELRVSDGGQYYGRFLLRPRPESRPSVQARIVAVSLADLVSRAFSAGTAARIAR
jgi:hypothetical protein